ncbi:MAG: bifunctional oligoribonuclease/PAP phosphatase NrnA [Clostridia bacterium]|nr:bifunctional oligoribonuclease/PAP phosphatase NrnA [Clostridia bacterium]
MNEAYLTAFRELMSMDDVLILVHRNPDGDCLGTAFALKRAFENLGRRVCVAATGTVDRNLRDITDGAEELKPTFLPSAIVSVDVATQPMLGPDLACYADTVDYNIDHHYTNTEYARNNIVFGSASSAGEVLFDLFRACDVEIDDVMAEKLYAAIAFDTGCFRYSNTTAHTHEVTAELLKYSFDAPAVIRKMFDIVPLRQLKLERVALDSLRLYHDGRVILLPITRKMLEENGAEDEDVSGMVSLIRRIEGAAVCATLKETKEGDVKVSLRSADDIFDVSAVASVFGGGGHVKASGCLIKGSMEDAEQRLLSAIEARLCGQEDGV